MNPQSLDQIPAASARLGLVWRLQSELDRFVKSPRLSRMQSLAVRTVATIVRATTVGNLCTAEAWGLFEHRYSRQLAGEVCVLLWRWLQNAEEAPAEGDEGEAVDVLGEMDETDGQSSFVDDTETPEFVFDDSERPWVGELPGVTLEDLAPEEAADVLVWANRQGIEPQLDDQLPESMLPYSLDWRARRTFVVTARMALEPPPGFALPLAGNSPALRRRAEKELREAAVAYLMRFAEFGARQRMLRTDRAQHAQPPSDPLLLELDRVLLEGKSRLLLDFQERPRTTYLPRAVNLVADPPTLVYTEELARSPLPAYPTSDPRSVTIGLSSWKSELLTFCCHVCRSSTGCEHVVSAIDEIHALLHDPRTWIHRDLPTVLRVPGWSRFLERLDRTLAAENPIVVANERLIWNVERYGGTVAVYPLIQKRGKRGGFSRGQRAPAQDLERWRRHSPVPSDRAAIDVLLGDRDDGLGYSPTIPLAPGSTFRVLLALAGSNNVFVGTQRTQPLLVARARLHLAFDEHEGVFLPRFRLGPIERPAMELANAVVNHRHLVLLEEGNNRCLLAELQPEVHSLIEIMGKYEAALPSEALAELTLRLSRFQGNLDIVVPEVVRGERVEANARIVARLTPMPEAGLRVELCVRPIEGGPAFAPGEGSAEVLGIREGRRVHAHRQLEGERERAHTLVREADITEEWMHGLWTWNVADDGVALEVLRVLGEKSQDAGQGVVIEWPEEKVHIHEVQRHQLRVTVLQRRDWFGLEGEAVSDDGSVSLAALLAAAREGKRYVKLGAHRFARIEDDLRKKLEALDDVVFADDESIDLGLLAAPILADLVQDDSQLKTTPAFRATLARLAQTDQVEPEVPEAMRAVLRHYQVDGYKWLARLAGWGLGGCLADDMGLGKTLQALALLLTRQHLGPALVIAPTSVVSNWADEASKFATGLNVQLYRGTNRADCLANLGKSDVLVTSYAIAVRDGELLKNHAFATLVIDEAQSVKNATTRRFRAVRDLVADFRVALTGTPVENHLGELWAIFRLVAPGLLGSWERFREKFAHPIERDRSARRQAALARVVRPFLLRRTKREVAPELPPRTEMNHLVELGPAERRLYESARIEALESLAGRAKTNSAEEGKRRMIVLAALTKLRLLACHPRLVLKDSVAPSAKLTALADLLAELKEEGHRALVFSQFTSFLDLVEPHLQGLGFSVLRLDGSTPAELRSERVAAFQARKAGVFLISLRAGGTGLNLTAASYVIHLDPWWNPAVEDQATDRAHRIGQDKPVTVIRLVANGTVEEKVLGMHAEKRKLAASILEGAELAARLDTDDLVDLMRTGVALEEEEDEEDGSGAEVPPSTPPPLAAV